MSTLHVGASRIVYNSEAVSIFFKVTKLVRFYTKHK